MERRKVLAAITAAIATPADAFYPALRGAGEGLDDETYCREVRPFAGLSPEEQRVKRFLSDQVQEYIGRLVHQPGHSPIVDLWVLCEALLVHDADKYSGQFGGLLNAIEDVTRGDRRFVVVPEEIHDEVDAFIEVSKASDETVIRVPNEIRETVLEVVRHLERHTDIELNLLLSDDSEEPGEGDLEPIKRWQIPARTGKAALAEVQA